MSSQIRISNRLRDDIHRFRSLHNTYEERAGYGRVTLAAANEIEVLHSALSRACQFMEQKIAEVDSRRMSLPITVEKIPGEDAYKVFLNQNPIGYAWPHDGKYTLTVYGHGSDSVVPILGNLEHINTRINELIDEGKVEPAEEPMKAPGGDL